MGGQGQAGNPGQGGGQEVQQVQRGAYPRLEPGHKSWSYLGGKVTSKFGGYRFN